MMCFDVWLAWNWEYDFDFVAVVAAVCRTNGLSFLSISPDNLEQVLQSLDERGPACRLFWDRASDSDDRFLPLVEWTRKQNARRINAYELSSRAWDKVSVHQLLAGSVSMPTTVILPAYNYLPQLPPFDPAALGHYFSVKPARRGGGEGVVIGATSPEQVQIARQQYPDDRYLLQGHVEPTYLGARPAWFRVIYALDEAFPCWWNAHTHVYEMVTTDEETLYGLAPLHALAATIASQCGLDVFSSEIALTAGGQFVVVDYVNDPLDLRLQSVYADGVPDVIATAVAQRVVQAVGDHDAAGDPCEHTGSSSSQ